MTLDWHEVLLAFVAISLLIQTPKASNNLDWDPDSAPDKLTLCADDGVFLPEGEGSDSHGSKGGRQLFRGGHSRPVSFPLAFNGMLDKYGNSDRQLGAPCNMERDERRKSTDEKQPCTDIANTLKRLSAIDRLTLSNLHWIAHSPHLPLHKALCGQCSPENTTQNMKTVLNLFSPSEEIDAGEDVALSSLRLDEHVIWEQKPPSPPSPTIPLYWITLDANSNRASSMERQIHRFGWSRIATRIVGVDGRGQSGGISGSNEFESLNKLVARDMLEFDPDALRNLPCYFHKCHATEVATLFSHLKAVRVAWKAGHKMVLIAEDDVDLSLFDEGALHRDILSAMPKNSNWSSLQLYTGNGKGLERLFRMPVGAQPMRGTTGHNQAGHSLSSQFQRMWSQAFTLYSKRGLDEIVQMFFDANGKIRLNRDIVSGLLGHVEVDNILKIAVQFPYISTRPLANVFLDKSIINDEDDSKCFDSDIVIASHATNLLGSAFRLRYGSDFEIAKTAKHMRLIHKAYHAGASSIVVCDGEMMSHLNKVHFHNLAQAIRAATMEADEYGSVIQLSTSNELVHMHFRHQKNKVLVRRPRYAYSGSVMYAVIGRDPLGRLASLWDPGTESVLIPANESFVMDQYLFASGPSVKLFAPQVMTSTASGPFDWMHLAKYRVSRKLTSGCKLCPAGYAVLRSNIMPPDSCLACTKGLYQNEEGQGRCLPCKSGQFQNQKGMSSCKDCDPGFYSDHNMNGTYCRQCPTGFSTTKSKVSCQGCLPGQYIDENNACRECPAGKFSDSAAQNSCKKCIGQVHNTSRKGGTCCRDSARDNQAETEGGTFCHLLDKISCRGNVRYYIERTDKLNPMWVYKSQDQDGTLIEKSVPEIKDIDLDGDLDILLGNKDGELIYFENIGSVYKPKFERDETRNPLAHVNVVSNSAPDLNDRDGDGDLDLIVGNKRGYIAYFENTGDSNHLIFTERSANDNPLRIVNEVLSAESAMNVKPKQADLDGDGDLDLIVGTRTGNLFYFENENTKYVKRDGAYNPVAEVDVGTFSQPNFHDFDNDGDLDMIVGNSKGKVYYFENTGSPTSPAFTRVTESSNPFSGVLTGPKDKKGHSALCVGDVDGDGDFDVFAGSGQGLKLQFFENVPATSAHTFVEASKVLNPMSFQSTGNDICSDMADLDADGDLDIILGTYHGSVIYFENIGSSTVPVYEESQKNPLGHISVGYFSDPALDDVDGDGDFDLFVGNKDGKVFYFENTGTPQEPRFEVAEEEQVFTPTFKHLRSNLSFASPELADMDSDGDIDLIVGYHNSDGPNVLLFLENAGSGEEVNGHFELSNGISFNIRYEADNPFHLIEAGPHPIPDIADIDGDCDFDLFVGNDHGEIRYYENIGTPEIATFIRRDGLMDPTKDIFVGSSCSPDVNDINGDGNMDLFVGTVQGELKLFTLEAGCTKSPACSGRGECKNKKTPPGLNGTGSSFVCLCPDWGGPQCQSCPLGKIEQEYFNRGSSINTPSTPGCTQCVPGMWSNRSSYTTPLNKHTCDLCPAGYFGESVAETNPKRACKECPRGFMQSKLGSVQCLPCFHGFAQSEAGQSSCYPCPEGKISDDTSLSKCKNCPVGTQPGAGSTSCELCRVGQYGVKVGVGCKICPAGYFQNNSGATECRLQTAGSIVVSGGFASVEVPHGMKIECSHSSTQSCNFKACPEGTYGAIPPSEKSCKKCPAGKSSFKSSTECFPCPKGKFAEKEGIACKNCPSGFFQPQNTRPSSQCKRCPSGFDQNGGIGEIRCIDLNWVKAEDCSSEEYLNDSDSFQANWTCVPCLRGASCLGKNAKWTTLGPLFGWWKIPEQERGDYSSGVFAKCVYPPSCPGGSNAVLANQFLDEDGSDLATKNEHYEQPVENDFGECMTAIGFRNYSRLCHACAPRYRRFGIDRCAPCPVAGQNWGLVFFGILVFLGLLLYVIRTTLSEGATEDLSQSIKKVMLNYLQVISLARSFPLHWPATITTLFEIQGAVSKMGDHIVNVDCLYTQASSGDLFYSKVIVLELLPLLAGLISFVFWYMYGMLKGMPFFKKRTHRKVKTPKDKFIVTVNVIIFLMYPTLCELIFSVFGCQLVGSKHYLSIDLEEPCYEGRHLTMIWVLGVGPLAMYVVGLPAIILWFLWRNTKKYHQFTKRKQVYGESLFKDPVIMTRWGLYYKGYENLANLICHFVEKYDTVATRCDQLTSPLSRTVFVLYS